MEKALFSHENNEADRGRKRLLLKRKKEDSEDEKERSDRGAGSRRSCNRYDPSSEKSGLSSAGSGSRAPGGDPAAGGFDVEAVRMDVDLAEKKNRKELLEQEMERIWKKDGVPVLVDPAGLSIAALRPAVVVDAILAKKNLGTTKEMAPLVIALGPGFTAGEDVDVVIETKRGHNLGRVIRSGSAVPNTGIPGIIGGYGKERVMHAQAEGILRNAASIGDIVEARAVIAEIETENGTVPVEASLSGLLRGLIRDGYPVTKGFKIADIDPRKEELQNCFTISDKARCIAGSVLEVICGELE